jgi:2-dehydro-3-deoxy-D-arabinonate dehydratase
VRDAPDPRQAAIGLEIHRDGERIFDGATSVADMKRSFDELVAALYRELSFPYGAVLLTGTGVVPPDELTLEHGDRVRIEVEGVGVLEHDIYESSG